MKYFIPATAKASELEGRIPFFWKNDRDDSVVLLGFVRGEEELLGLNARLCQLRKQWGCLDAPVQLKRWERGMGRLCALADGRVGVKEGELEDGAATCFYYELPPRLEDVQALVPPGATHPDDDIFAKV